MSTYDVRRLVEQNIDFDKTSWKRFGTGDPATMLGREFVRSVSLILGCHLNHLLRSNGLRQGPPESRTQVRIPAGPFILLASIVFSWCINYLVKPTSKRVVMRDVGC